MRRKNAISVKVKAPSRGLVTRWPSESADLAQGISQAQALAGVFGIPGVLNTDRVCAVAQNVRFENGVIATAPGYEVVLITGGGGLLPETCKLIYQADVTTAPTTPLFLGTTSHLYLVSRTYQDSPRQFQATLSTFFTGTALTDGYHWSAADFYDKVIFVQHDNVPQYWLESFTATKDLPGLNRNINQFSDTSDGSEKYDGATVFFGHVLLWKNDVLAWSDLDDFTNYIPIPTTVVSATLGITSSFVQPAAGSIVVVTVQPSVTTASKILSPSGSLVFGNVVKSTTSQLALVLTNIGNTTVTVSSLTLPTGFTGSFAGTIAAGASQSITITFSPVLTIGYGGDIIVNSDATGTVAIAVSGVGVAVTKIISLSGTMDVGTVVTSVTVVTTLMITNLGNTTLTVTGVKYPPQFTGSNFSGTIAPGAVQDIAVTFTSSGAAATVWSDIITVNSDATSGTNTILITGTSAGAGAGQKIIFLSQDGLNFGNVLVGDTATGTLTITNAGNAAFTVTGISLPPGFSGTLGSQSISGGSANSVAVTITFSPTVAAAYSGTIEVRISSSDTVVGSNLMGTFGTGTVISLAGNLVFPNTTINQTAIAVLTITNLTVNAVSVASLSLPTGFTSSFSSGSIAAGASQTATITFSPVAATIYAGVIVVNTTIAAGSSSIVASGTGVPTTTTAQIVVDQFVRIDDTKTTGQPFYNFYQVTVVTPTTLTLKLLGTTGHTSAGTTIPATTTVSNVAAPVIQTLDANEAGNVQNGGALINGPIFQVLPMGDYAYIFKEWSIQSIQYVGIGQGIFYIHTEVVREGPIGRNAIKNLGNGNIIFLGHRELYSYSGGSSPNPVCRQYTRQLLSELDRSQIDDVIISHRESQNEVWVIYPVVGGQKILIWNYVEDTATLDIYDPALMQIKALTEVGWDTDPVWFEQAPSLLWDTVDPGLTWADFIGSGVQQVGVMTSGDNHLLIHGLVYSRGGQGYTALAETMDYDFEDRAVFKYVDAVHVGLQVLAPSTSTEALFVQVGYRSSLDEDITWTPAQVIYVQGNANFTAKVNPGGAGRFIRLRFYSQGPDVLFKISSFEIYGRAGGTY